MLMRSALVFVRMQTLRFPSTDWWRHGLAQRPPAVKLLWTLKATVWLMRLPLCRSHPGLRTESHTKVWNCKVWVTQLCFSFLVFFPYSGLLAVPCEFDGWLSLFCKTVFGIVIRDWFESEDLFGSCCDPNIGSSKYQPVMFQVSFSFFRQRFIASGACAFDLCS